MDDTTILISRQPIHPGEFLREDYMPEMGLTVASLAEKLGVSRQTVNELVHERRNLSADMSLRLARLFGTTARFWMSMQEKVDLWNSLELNREAIEAIEPLEVVEVA